LTPSASRETDLSQPVSRPVGVNEWSIHPVKQTPGKIENSKRDQVTRLALRIIELIRGLSWGLSFILLFFKMDEETMKAQAERARDVFGKLRELGRFGESPTALECLADCAAGLCRSPLALVYFLESADKGWQRVAAHHSGELAATSPPLEARLDSLWRKLETRDFAFEPFRDAGEGAVPRRFLLVFKVEREGKQWAVAVLPESDSRERFNEVVVRTQLLAALLSADPKAGGGGAELAVVLRILDEVLQKSRFELAAMTLVDALAAEFPGLRVSLGFYRRGEIRTVAVSGLERFEANSEGIREQLSLFDECLEQEAELAVPEGGTQDESVERIVHEHRRYLAAHGLAQVVTYPLVGRGRPFGVLLVEASGKTLDEMERRQIRLVGKLTAGWLETLAAREQPMLSRVAESLRERAAWCLGPRQTLLKLGVVAAVVFLIAGLTLPIDFKLSATATLETDEVGYLAAPFNGYIEAVKADVGDAVTAGRGLIELNREELELRELEEAANLQRFSSEVEKARSTRELVDMKVAMARAQQAEAELRRIRYYLEHATLTAPFDGIIVEGARVELLGAPVNKGDVLMKVANPSELFVRIKLNERDIDFVENGASGRLKLLSQPGQTHAFEVFRILPAAQVDPVEGNAFILRARLAEAPAPWWRPGMSGVVEIDAGRRPFLVVWLHRTWDTLRMKLWL
jgi:multidrug resistance efflux pump